MQSSKARRPAPRRPAAGGRRASWRRLILESFVVALFVGASPVAADDGPLSISDILDGIRSRRTRHNAIKVVYEHQTRPTPYLADSVILREKRVAAVRETVTTTSKAGSGTAKDDAASSNTVSAKKRDKLVERAQDEAILRSVDQTLRRYELLSAGDRRAFSRYRISPEGESVLLQKGVFDGEVLRILHADKPRGSIKRTTPDEALQFPTIADLTGINGADVEAYLKQHEADLHVTAIEQINGDIVAVVEHRRPLPVVGSSATSTNITRLGFNTSKDFWLSEVDIALEVKEPQWSEPQQLPVLRTEILSYHDVDGSAYPKELKTTWYDVIPSGPNASDGKVATPDLSPKDFKPIRIEHVRVLDVALNPRLTADAFDLPFPPGTRYRDEIRDSQFIVGVDGIVRDLADVLDKPILPVSEYSEKEAAKILIKHKRGQEASWWWWLAFVNGAILCAIAGVWVIRRFCWVRKSK